MAENEQDDRAEAVERHAWAEEEAGVQPFALRIRAGEEAAEKQLQHPAAAGAEEEQKYNDQKYLIFCHKIPPCNSIACFAVDCNSGVNRV